MTFISTGAGLLRAARLPLSHPVPPTPADLSDSLDVPAWLTWLAEVWKDPLLADAMRAASPDLTRALEALLASGEPTRDEVRRVSTTVLRYTLRARYRATPFGFFAFTAPARLGESCVIPPLAAQKAVARADARWLAPVLDQLHTHPGILEFLNVVTDPTCRIGSDRVVVPYRPAEDHPEQVRSTATAPLRLLLTVAARPAPLTRVADQIQEAFPAVARAKVLSLISTAIRSGLLHSDLGPSSLDPFPLRHIRTVLDGVPSGKPVAARIRQIDDLLSVSDSVPAHEAARRREYAEQLMLALADPGTSPLMTDLHCTETVTVPDRLAQDVAGALDVLARISEHPHGSPGWIDYRQQFFERYSLGVLVPVLELLDPDTGLGYPAGFLGSTRSEPDLPPTKRDGYLLTKLEQVLLDGAQELDLNEDDITALQRESTPHLWPTVEVTLAVHASSAAALERGDYRLLIEGMGAAAGVFTGRFLPLMDQDEQQRAAAVHQALPTLDEEAIRVQVCSPPLRRRAQNLSRTLQLAPDVLALGEYTPQATIQLADIAVAAAADRLYLVHTPTGRRIEPFTPTAVNQQDATDPLARFLTELPRSHAAVLSPFVWGQTMKDLPFLPRLRAGRVVISPARWHVTASRLGPERDLAEAVATWRRRWRVPAIVSAGGNDQRLRLNLEDSVHRRVLADMIRSNRNPLRVQEAADDHAHGWLGRAGQLTISFAAIQPHPPAPSRILAPVQVNDEDIRWPGTAATVLLRIDTDTARTGDLFAAGLADLLDTSPHIKRWWFTRYRDPQPHLRVRVTLHQAEGFSDIAAAVAEWAAQARLARSISWHTDRPETGRYGTGSVLASAEAFFAADSRAALAQEGTPARAPHEREALLVTSLLDITRHLMPGDLAALRRWDTGTGRGAAPGFDRPARRLALRLCADLGQVDFTGLDGGTELDQTWQARAAALDDYATSVRDAGHSIEQVLPALLHMHFIRAYGVDAEHENHVQRCVRELAHSLLARAEIRSTADQKAPA